MAVLLMNSNFVITGYIMPFILFLSTWIMVSKQITCISASTETTVLMMAFLIKVLAFVIIGYYRMHKNFVKLFIVQFEAKQRQEELQFLMDQQDHGVMIMLANRKYNESRLVFQNTSAQTMIDQAYIAKSDYMDWE